MKLDDKFEEITRKYNYNSQIEAFMNINRYGKPFLRVNVYGLNDDITQTFNWTERDYQRALDFINKWENKINIE